MRIARSEWPFLDNVEEPDAKQRLRRLANPGKRRGNMQIGGAGDAAIAGLQREVAADSLAGRNKTLGAGNAALNVDVGAKSVQHTKAKCPTQIGRRA